MGLNRFLKYGLFIYECLRILIVIIFLVVQQNGSGSIAGISYAASIALFPLMALFICLNTERYKVYLPLFAAGKTIAIVLGIGWLITHQSGTMYGELELLLTQIVLSGDLFALTAVLLIIKNINNIQKPAETLEEN
ncbi:MAG: hypothetical protein FWD28_08615 [Treponema sp.]|nr:hypothetical protein [Treponema sp.]